MLITAVYLFAICWILAQLEIQIEGPDGWVSKIPTWRLNAPWILRFTNGKPITGYHVYLTALLLALFHFPLIFIPFSKILEAKILSSYFLATFIWDFQWFVWNPGWGIKRFFKDPIWWFPVKIMGFPLEYYLGLIASFLTVALLSPTSLKQWLDLVGWLILASFISVLLSMGVFQATER